MIKLLFCHGLMHFPTVMNYTFENTEQSSTKPNLVAKILATKFGIFCDIYNALKNMLNMSLMIIS